MDMYIISRNQSSIGIMGNRARYLDLALGDLLLFLFLIDWRGEGNDVIEEKHPRALDRVVAGEQRAIEDKVAMRGHQALPDEQSTQNNINILNVQKEMESE